MPEGDTLFRTAAGLRPHLVGRAVTAARADGPGAVPQIASARRPDDRRGRGARQEPAHPVRRRPRAAHAPADERVVAPLPAGRAVAPARRPGAPRARGARRGRGLLRRAGGRALRGASGSRPSVALAPRSGPARPRLRCRRGRRRLRDPARAGTEIGVALLDQRALAGIGNVYKNEILWIERVSPFATVAALDDATLDRLIATARRLLVAERGAEPRPRTRHDDR